MLPSQVLKHLILRVVVTSNYGDFPDVSSSGIKSFAFFVLILSKRHNLQFGYCEQRIVLTSILNNFSGNVVKGLFNTYSAFGDRPGSSEA
ncbi:hypothetical protein Pla144_06290 [Bythopirellula polymerisocia]|uniref:Uncharacterized protein n=1 Tax=Bythopirellula polymerisocia TaxID=2528003 RepID=A0A5C6D4Q5_9BACT|nr:hypothetical protein Pla144_06290 [Bythopirellula polymerisocia]